MVRTVELDSAALEVCAPVKQSGALVIGGDYRGLGVVRSLGRQGIPVWVITTEHTLAAHSRYCLHRLPWAASGDSAKTDFLLELGKQLSGWTLYPTADESADMIARSHAALSQYFILTVPAWDKLRWATDKRLTYRFAEEYDLDIPRTYYPNSPAEVAKLDCKFPAIVKPAIHRGFNRFLHDKGWIANGKEELIRLYDAACALVGPEIVMVQEVIPGDGEAQFSCAALCREGEPLAVTTARRTRQYPLELGRASTYVETVENSTVERHTYKLLRAMRYTGLVEVEFKFDARDGTYRLLDANPRVWGWHTLCGRAGVDFPYLLWRMLHNEPVEPVRARAGVRWVRTVTDLWAVAHGMIRGSLAVREYLGSLRTPLEFAVFAKDDVLPAIMEMPLLARIALRRGALWHAS